ncbi:MAG: protein-disulfide reductase DsbD family protein [Rhodospirillales bacterium]|nr:protein-disulfide reductase DsbD family protein [Rhodospirillales bacterium]
MNQILKVFSLLILSALWGTEVHAAASEWSKTDYATVRLISATKNLGNEKFIPLGLHFKLQPGWKVYWRSPGDAGYPPRLKWDGSENFKSATMKWPQPKQFSILGLETLGYKEEVVFPLNMEINSASTPAHLKLAVDFLTCSDICVPLQADLTLTLDPGKGVPSEHMQLVSRFASQVPGVQQANNDWIQGLSLSAVGLTSDSKQTTLWVQGKSKTALTKPDLYVEGPVDYIFKAVKTGTTSDAKEVLFQVPVDGKYAEGKIIGEPITLTMVDKTRSVEKSFTLKVQPIPQMSVSTLNPSSSSKGSGGIWLMLGFALIGGLILNLMPCVLPVLSIKLLGVIKHGGGDVGHVRLSFLASAAGIITSFLGLAAVLIFLKSAGITIGWGIQFQQSWFLIAMVMMISIFAFNLWGLFEISLPSWAGQAGERSSRVEGLSGHFLSGALATLLATPCSAPFLGTAVGFAFSKGAIEIGAIFLALGIGLALPYLLVAARPTLATRLPKPGPWMVTLRKILGFALAATAIWLLSVLEVQTGMTTVLVIGGLMILAGIVLKVGSKPIAWTSVALIALVAFLSPSQFPASKAEAEQVMDDGVWAPFDQSKIPTLIDGGKLVIVDVTADWCITCQVNKKFVFGDSTVMAQLASDSIVAMKADWTKPNETIADYLSSYNRYGIPFNVVYGPGAPEGIVLPEVMTPDMVMAAIKKAKE